MLSHIKLKIYFKIFEKEESESVNKEKVQALAQTIENLYDTSSENVKRNNIDMIREIHSLGFGSEYENINSTNLCAIQKCKESPHLYSSFCFKGMKYGSKSIEFIEENLNRQVRNIWFDRFIKTLEIRQSSLTLLFKEYSKIDSNTKK